MNFVTKHSDIMALIDAVDPVKYGITRNYLDGAVTKLSPYISRGVISTKQVAKAILKKGYHPQQILIFLKELAWRDYFQQTWAELGANINTDVKQTQTKVSHFAIPQHIIDANTGITAIDNGINSLYQTGYMHNHMRMYVAGLTCNIGQSHWLHPARWMYYHLLDADWASNALSWQWVAGSFNNKKYIANQENINTYCSTSQTNTYLDMPYDALEKIAIPEALVQTTTFNLKTDLPLTPEPKLNNNQPIFIYNFYNLDSQWNRNIQANRILLLEPDFFEQYPVSPKTLGFVMALSENIKDIQVVVGAFDAIFKPEQYHKIHYKEHPTNLHYKGNKHERDWMFGQVKGYHPSFYAYWKKCEMLFNQLIN